MKIRFFNVDELEKKYRISVHRSGRLGFTAEAEKALKLTNDNSVSLGQNEEDESDQALYLYVHPRIEPGAFKLAKSGGYYFLNTKLLFDKLKIDYSEGTIAFDMERLDGENEGFFKLTLVDRKAREEKKDAELAPEQTNDEFQN